MSEVSKTTDNDSKREPYKVEIDPIDFEQDCSLKFVRSTDLCRLANEYFRAAFADFEGSTFSVDQGYATISLYFNHKEVDGVRAVERAAGKTVGNTIMDKTRGRDLQYKEGDRYHITDDGADIIKSLLIPRLYNNGKPNWKNIVVDITDRTSMNVFRMQQPNQLTKISGIDPRQICALIYGKKDNNGEYIDYGIEIKANLDIRAGLIPGNQAPDYVLAVTRAFNGNLQKTYEKFGLNAGGSTIIR
jgi:hypothetical protein